MMIYYHELLYYVLLLFGQYHIQYPLPIEEICKRIALTHNNSCDYSLMPERASKTLPNSLNAKQIDAFNVS